MMASISNEWLFWEWFLMKIHGLFSVYTTFPNKFSCCAWSNDTILNSTWVYVTHDDIRTCWPLVQHSTCSCMLGSPTIVVWECSSVLHLRRTAHGRWFPWFKRNMGIIHRTTTTKNCSTIRVENVKRRMTENRFRIIIRSIFICTQNIILAILVDLFCCRHTFFLCFPDVFYTTKCGTLVWRITNYTTA